MCVCVCVCACAGQGRGTSTCVLGWFRGWAYWSYLSDQWGTYDDTVSLSLSLGLKRDPRVQMQMVEIRLVRGLVTWLPGSSPS